MALAGREQEEEAAVLFALSDMVSECCCMQLPLLAVTGVALGICQAGTQVRGS
jgi:hypothetical protein